MLSLVQWIVNKYYIFREPAFGLRHLTFCHLWPARIYSIFSPYFINGNDFRKIAIEHKMCVLIFSTSFVRNISHSKKNCEIFDQNVCRPSCKPTFLSDFDKI
jgi:hypothetical protein